MSDKNGVNGHAVVQPPKTWDRGQVDQILKKVCEGASLRDACLDVGIPRSTFTDWVMNNIDGVGDQYARAREVQMDAMEAEILAIADDSRKDTTTRRDAQGNQYEVPDNEWIARSKLRVDTRRWIMSKVAWKKYGDRMDSTIQVNGRQVIQVEIDPNRNHREQMAERDAPLELTNGNGH